jgi:hypothetical protein
MRKKTFLPELHDLTDSLDESVLGRMFDWACEMTPPLFPCLIIPLEGEGGNWDPILERMRRSGGVPVLHGMSHRAPAGFWDRFWFGESFGAEFRSPSQPEARHRIERGRKVLEGLVGGPVSWFCAPRWRQNPATIEALRELQFKGLMTRRGFYLVEGGDFVPVPVLSYAHGQRAFVMRLNSFTRGLQTARILASGRPFRWALHPGDLENPSVRREIADLRKRLENEGWKPAGQRDTASLFS